MELFDGQAWLVSKCGPRIQQRSLDWLVLHRYLFGPQRTAPAGLTHTPDWPTAEAAVSTDAMVAVGTHRGAQRRV